MNAAQIAQGALRLDWSNVESQARRVAEYAEERIASNRLAADNLEAEYLAVANGVKKPGKLDLEVLVRAVQALRSGASEPEPATLSVKNAVAQVLSPAGYLFQHDDSGRTTFVATQDRASFEEANGDRWSFVGGAVLIPSPGVANV
ncbi:hypothetical protein M0D69_13730 [Caballeronia sp. SEWSISQ10-4 2]|uniref:hypothetical protein n=1 Tax=Caballeronia sp. SEWSISQ10-4 2 TaxID=2937438 RepID=UPI0026545FFF|nr:hypothetical protein [Caballeronia sp. SEWSISQ10-4 2]MDN7179053.1 hypothetical protein [Caballeronia sp. SEWSISQ10-4 2]